MYARARSEFDWMKKKKKLREERHRLGCYLHENKEEIHDRGYPCFLVYLEEHSL